MKWAFLLGRETLSHGGSSYYRFVPYLYGPHSFTLYQEINSLLRDGVLEHGDDGHLWQLSESVQRQNVSLPEPVKTDVRYIMNKYGSMSRRQLLDIVYERYPWFTINCEDAGKRRASRPVADVAVYTIGYEGLSVDDFLNRLLENGVQCLLDVRNNPVSRRYGFHKSTLSRLCGFLGIEYFHFPELGIPRSRREGLQGKEDYERLFKEYRHSILPAQSRTLKRLARIMNDRPGVLICMEADPMHCHRTTLAEALSPIARLPVIHLGWPR
ncbi:MAG: DUF488 domain-containing protein [Roseiflexus sp.]